MNCFWKDGLSVDESKISILIISFIITLVCALISYFMSGAIGDNLTKIVTVLIYAVAGVNVADKIKSMIGGGM